LRPDAAPRRSLDNARHRAQSSPSSPPQNPTVHRMMRYSGFVGKLGSGGRYGLPQPHRGRTARQSEEG
jgi:hypothetical protein